MSGARCAVVTGVPRWAVRWFRRLEWRLKVASADAADSPWTAGGIKALTEEFPGSEYDNTLTRSRISAKKKCSKLLDSIISVKLSECKLSERRILDSTCTFLGSDRRLLPCSAVIESYDAVLI